MKPTSPQGIPPDAPPDRGRFTSVAGAGAAHKKVASRSSETRKTRSRSVLPLLTVSITLVAALSSKSWGQQILCDPENPNLPCPAPDSVGEPEETSIHAESADQPAGDSERPGEPAISEIIRDPERPGLEATPDSLTTDRTALNRSWFSGRLLSSFFFDTAHENNVEDVFLLRNRLTLGARLDLGEHLSAVLEGRLEHRLWGEGNPDGIDLFVNGENYQGDFDAHLRDAYLSARFGSLFLSFGNQTVVWGAGTLSRPADVINPVDYSGGTFDRPAEQRIPVVALQTSLVLDQLSLSAVLVPFFSPDRLEVVGSDFAIFRPGGGVEETILVHSVLARLFDPSLEAQLEQMLLVTEYPEALPQNVSAGGRLTSSYGGVDIGLGYFFGWDRTPYLEVNRDLQEILDQLVETERLESPFASEYRRLHSVTFDLATYVDRLGLRLEAAFHPQRTLYTTGYLPRRYTVLDTALALSYEDTESLVLQLEGYWMHTFEVPSWEELLLTGVDYHGLRFLAVLGLDWFDALKGSILGRFTIRMAGSVGLSTDELLLFPSLSYSLFDALDLVAGAALYEGPPVDESVTIAGFYEENDELFLSLELAF